MLLGTLRDDQADSSDRLLAAELAADCVVIDDALVDALLSVVRNGEEPEKLRAQAALSLGPVLELADTDGFELADDSVPISEATFLGIQKSLRGLYMDADVPEEVRRWILEASVRAPQDWHQAAVRAAYASDSRDWKLTAVFSMGWVRGFAEQILEALDSADRDIHYQAVHAAGHEELDAAWSHIARLLISTETEKFLRLAAIDAVTTIRPEEAVIILADLTDSDDEDIVDAALEAMIMAEGLAGSELADDEDEDTSLH
ncbi:MAG: hypothetical protein V3V67_00340 [Myxococcota bacterium]